MNKTEKMSVNESELSVKREMHPDFEMLSDQLLRQIEENPNVTQYDVEKKILSLKLLLERDMKAADFKWSLFVSACHTYRYDSCLKPFPPFFIKNNVADIEGLRKLIETAPPLKILYDQLLKSDAYQLYGNLIDLLYWVLFILRDPHLKSVNKNSIDSVLSRVPSEMPIASPNMVFQINHVKHSSSEERWKSMKQNHSSFYAYHGSKLENFHSILHYGLQQIMCKADFFGKGIYLSSELGISVSYSPVGYGWGGSLLGGELSCVALCEVLNHPDVKRGDTSDPRRNIVKDTLGGKIPNKFYVIQNSELVRVRYLLVYTQEFGISRCQMNAGFIGWIKHNKLLTFVIGYVMFLASVGLARNKDMEKYYKLFIQKFGLK